MTMTGWIDLQHNEQQENDKTECNKSSYKLFIWEMWNETMKLQRSASVAMCWYVQHIQAMHTSLQLSSSRCSWTVPGLELKRTLVELPQLLWRRGNERSSSSQTLVDNRSHAPQVWLGIVVQGHQHLWSLATTSNSNQKSHYYSCCGFCLTGSQWHSPTHYVNCHCIMLDRTILYDNLWMYALVYSHKNVKNIHKIEVGVGLLVVTIW